VLLPQYSDTHYFSAPQGVDMVKIDKTQICSATSLPDSVDIAFLDGTAPTETCDAAGQTDILQKIFVSQAGELIRVRFIRRFRCRRHGLALLTQNVTRASGPECACESVLRTVCTALRHAIDPRLAPDRIMRGAAVFFPIGHDASSESSSTLAVTSLRATASLLRSFPHQRSDLANGFVAVTNKSPT